MAASVLGLICATPISAQDNAWIYNTFVDKCRAAGGTPGSSLAQFQRGETFVCRQGGGASVTGPGDDCERTARQNVDWVLRDRGALTTFTRLTASGYAAVDAVIEAQAHNFRAQESIRRCRDWAIEYLARVYGPDRTKPVTASDCSCITVLPHENRDAQRFSYSVRNACDPMDVAIQFGGDILKMSASVAMSAWAAAGRLSPGQQAVVSTPQGWTYATILATRLTRGSSSYTCRYN
ncbi:hypothetical protein MWN33_14015 [Starkeya koreensis]|uniref:Ig-like domain-containing protein n=1 Tax=Ancylobacter koreensis TaxID=266121 RepID=A0ABT0DPW1_9HYPH|nr:hypothetical protein [Ancylobacter koreensis]MCK0209147.1 hypothetical protein [Ancylobacter koreensis]